MYGRPGGVGGVGVGGLAGTGFAFGVWTAVGVAAIVAGLLLLRIAMFRRKIPQEPKC